MYEDVFEIVRKEMEKEPGKYNLNCMDWYFKDFLQMMIVSSFLQNPVSN